MDSSFTTSPSNHPSPFFLVSEESGTSIASVESYETFFTASSTSHTVALVNPSANPQDPIWPLQNRLSYLRAVYPTKTSSVFTAGATVNCRLPKGKVDIWHCVVHWRSIDGRPEVFGWEENSQGKLGPRVTDVAPMVDPTRLMAQAVDLNLRMMRRRILPSLIQITPRCWHAPLLCRPSLNDTPWTSSRNSTSLSLASTGASNYRPCQFGTNLVLESGSATSLRVRGLPGETQTPMGSCKDEDIPRNRPRFFVSFEQHPTNNLAQQDT